MKISVVIPTYNRYEVLKRALNSVYAQTHQPTEVIVIDDGSTDTTSQIQKDFPSIIYRYQENAGVSSARNLGIALCSNEWIAFLDSDDEWFEEKLAYHVALHASDKELMFSYTDEKWIRDDKEVKIPKKFHKHSGDIFDKCLSHCIIAPSSALIHKSIFDDIGLFDESLEVCEDYDLWLRITCKYKAGLIEKPLIVKYGGNDDQLSTKYWGMDRFRVKALEKLLALYPEGTSHVREDEVKEMLVKKYKLLLQGAQKHQKSEEIKHYEESLQRMGIEY
ncbi:glycosyltransferase family 2 protein [bacterium]|nr:glycosyltransferase family 2 protein [bacterium]MBU1883815.1 glycosyltransferase family 2 protein [bacterium]